MSIIGFQRPDLSRFSCHGIENCFRSCRTTVSPTMNFNQPTSKPKKKEEFSVELQPQLVPQHHTPTPSNLCFDRSFPSDQGSDHTHKIDFGRFVVREVILDEEYWTAAWLRAESHWEDRPNERYIESYKRKFADQEFNELKRRCSGKYIKKCACIVAVKKDEKSVKRTILKSVVGTLDLSFQQLLLGETFPGERVKARMFSSINRTSQHKYGYVANLSVSKFARRQGIASSMLLFAIASSRSNGVEQVFVHVDRQNIPARELYQKMGFKMVEMATPHLLEEKKYLLCYKA